MRSYRPAEEGAGPGRRTRPGCSAVVRSFRQTGRPFTAPGSAESESSGVDRGIHRSSSSNNRRDSLIDDRPRVQVGGEPRGVVPVGVDEARGECQPAGVDDRVAGRGRDVCERDDRVSGDTHTAQRGGGARPVDDAHVDEGGARHPLRRMLAVGRHRREDRNGVSRCDFMQESVRLRRR